MLATANQTLHTIGHEVLGPAFAYFLDRTRDRVRETGVDRLLFVAREGWLLEQLYDALGEGSSPGPSTGYVHFSRLSTALASARELGRREIRLGLLKPGQLLANVLRSYDLYDDEILRLVREVADPEEVIANPWEHPTIERLLRHDRLQAAVRGRAEAARALLRDYLEQEGMLAAARPALVDVGWGGTIQKNLACAFADDPRVPAPRGFYLGLLDTPWAGRYPEVLARMEGLLVDFRTVRRGLAERALFYFLEIFEQSARAPHGTTLGYRREGGRVEPILKDVGKARQAELESARTIAELQRGILAAARGYRLRQRGFADRESERQDVLARLERFVFVPTRAEAEAVAGLMHTDDWGLDGYQPLIGERGLRLEQPRAWLERFHRTYWKPGFLRLTWGPAAARAYHLYARLHPKTI